MAIGTGLAILGGAAIGAIGSNKAAKSQQAAASSANQLQWDMYQQNREDLTPYREAGGNALARIQALLQNPQAVSQEPGYQFGMGEGTKAIERSAAGRGGLYSGATLKALQRFGQDYAGTKTNELFNRYASVAGIGQTATNQTGMYGQNYAQNAGNNMVGVGNARAGSYMNQGANWQNAINQMAAFGQQKVPYYGATGNDLDAMSQNWY